MNLPEPTSSNMQAIDLFEENLSKIEQLRFDVSRNKGGAWKWEPSNRQDLTVELPDDTVMKIQLIFFLSKSLRSYSTQSIALSENFQELTDRLQRFCRIFNDFSQLSPDNSWKVQEVNLRSHSNSLQTHSDQLLTTLIETIRFIHVIQWDLFAFDENRKRVEATSAKIHKIETEAEASLDQIRSKFGSVSAGIFSETFQSQANHHGYVAGLWLRLFILVSLAGILLLFFILTTDNSTTILGMWHYFLIRIAVVSLLVGILTWMGKNYSAERHNEIVNRHRQLALDTYKIFRESAEQTVVKDQVLLHVANCAFAHVSTGYSGSDKDFNINLPAMDIAKTMTQTPPHS